MVENNDILYLSHIRDACLKISTYIKDVDYQKFETDAKTQDAVIRQIGIIGEAARQISSAAKKDFDLDWKSIIGMRDKLVHDYIGVDIKIVWETATKDVSELLEEIRKYES